MKKLISLTILLCGNIGLNLHGQTVPVPTKFEGEIKAIRTNNLDRNTEKISGGFGYNGATKFSYFIKDDKALAVDSTLHYSTLYDPSAGTITMWGHYMRKGVAISWDDYEMVLKSWSNAQRQYKGNILPPYDVYTITPIKENCEVLCYSSKIYNVNFEIHNPISNSRNDIVIETIPQFILSEAASGAIANCIDIDGIPARIKAIMEIRVEMKVFKKHIKSYLGLDVTEIIPNADLPDSIFEIPSDIKIKKGGFIKWNRFIKKNIKHLKKKGLYPKDDEVIFELEDEDWIY